MASSLTLTISLLTGCGVAPGQFAHGAAFDDLASSLQQMMTTAGAEELDECEYVGGLLLIGFMHRLYGEYVVSSVLWLLLLKKKTDRRDIIARLVGRSGSKLLDFDRSYTAKKSSSLKEDDDDDEEEEEKSLLSVD